MTHRLVVNPELYVLAFTTNDNMHFDLIRNCIRTVVPNSKKKETYSNKQDSLLVSDEYYEAVINTVSSFLRDNNKEQNVYWVSRNGIFIPCGYYQVAVADLGESSYKSAKEKELEVENYCKNISADLRTQLYFPYDYLSHTYSINLRGDCYEKLLLSFNRFVLKNGLGPFKQLKVTTRYGELVQQEYPILSKKR